MHNIIIVVRDPDASNEFFTFGPDDTLIIDVDLGYADLSDEDEFAEWAKGHLDDATEFESYTTAKCDATALLSYREAAAFLRDQVEQVRSRYDHPEPEAETPTAGPRCAGCGAPTAWPVMRCKECQS